MRFPRKALQMIRFHHCSYQSERQARWCIPSSFWTGQPHLLSFSKFTLEWYPAALCSSWCQSLKVPCRAPQLWSLHLCSNLAWSWDSASPLESDECWGTSLHLRAHQLRWSRLSYHRTSKSETLHSLSCLHSSQHHLQSSWVLSQRHLETPC